MYILYYKCSFESINGLIGSYGGLKCSFESISGLIGRVMVVLNVGEWDVELRGSMD